MSKTRMEYLLESLEDDGILHDETAIRDRLSRLPIEDLSGMAYSWLRVARQSWERKRTLLVERAVLSTAPHKAEIVQKYDPYLPLGPEWNCIDNPASERGKSWLKSELEFERRIEESNERMRARVNAAIADMRSALRSEWTAELLSQGISMPDGTRTTWGEATLAQHQERLQMFKNNAAANMEGAARHQKAIDDIASANATCLADLQPLGRAA